MTQTKLQERQKDKDRETGKRKKEPRQKNITGSFLIRFGFGRVDFIITRRRFGHRKLGEGFGRQKRASDGVPQQLRPVAQKGFGSPTLRSWGNGAQAMIERKLENESDSGRKCYGLKLFKMRMRKNGGEEIGMYRYTK